MSHVRIEGLGHVCVVTMSHRERRNALSDDMTNDLIAALESAKAEGCRVVVVRAEEGATVWSSGHAIDELPGDGVDPVTWVSPVERLLAVIGDADFPVIAAVEGGAWGASCNLALACDLVIATESATFTITPAKLGIPYHLDGIAQFLSGVPLNIAREMLFTAEPVTAQRMYDLGVVNRLVPDGRALTGNVLAVAQRIAELAPLSIGAMKADIRALTQGPALDAALTKTLADRRRRAWASDDFQEGVAAFLEKRAPRFSGS